MTSINISPCIENPQRALKNAFHHRNVDAFKFALENLRADPNHVDRDNDLTIFEDILQTPNTAQFITLCIENGADMYKRNSRAFYPLHYAVDSYSPQNLKAFLATYDSNKINVKYNHKNSLHLIMENLPKIDYENASEIVKILIQHGCDVNMPNEKSRTPFNLLLRVQPKLKNKNELVDYILEHCEDVDLYTYRSKETIDLFRKNNPEREIPPQTERSVDSLSLLAFLRQRNQQKFIANYMAFKDGEMSKQKSEENAENKSNDFKEISAQFLYTAIENDCENVVEYLVDDGVDVTKKPSEFAQRFKPVMLACSRGNFQMLEALFRASPPPETSDGKKNLLHLATEHFGMDPSQNLSYNYKKCFNIALKYCDDVNQQDEFGFTPLHYAARYRNDTAVLELLQRGAYIGAKSLTGETPIENMSHDALETYLDECISTKPRRHGDEKQQIIIDYNFLVAPNKFDEFGAEIEPLREISKHQELRPLIAHPVLSSFLFLKWSKLSLFFHLNLAMFSMFMVSLIVFIILSQTQTPEEQAKSGCYNFFQCLSLISVFMLLFRELFQLFLSPRNYLKNPINYFEVLLIVLGFILILYQHSDPNNVHMRILRAVTILFAAYEFLQLIGTLPYFSISTHMVILKKVAVTFLKSLLLYSILILAFALSFFSLFGGKKKNEEMGGKAGNETAVEKEEENDAFNSFGYPGIAIIKTMVMLTGEFDASSLALDQNDAFYSVFFLLFVFLITIVLFNLLNALAIDDTQQIRVEGELVDLCERIKVLSKYERVILGSSGSLFKKIISLFPYTVPRGKIVIHPDNYNEIMTYKVTPISKDVSINIGDDQELQNLNNNHLSLKRLIPNQKISDQLERYSRGMDKKVMKKIRIIFDEKKQQENDEMTALKKQLSSMESEIKILKSGIQDLTEKLTQQFNLK